MLGGLAWRKTSLIDFPGRVAAVLFLSGCTFRCPYCHNPELVGRGGGAPGAGLGEFLIFLDRRASLISGLVISGGEPLLHEETPRIAEAARARALAVKLDTNGYFPERIAPVRADYVALDFKTAPEHYDRVAPGLPDAGERVLESLRRVREGGTEFEIRITCAPDIVGIEELEAMAAYLEPADRVILQPFRPGECLDPDWNLRKPHDGAYLDRMLARLRIRVPGARIRGRM